MTARFRLAVAALGCGATFGIVVAAPAAAQGSVASRAAAPSVAPGTGSIIGVTVDSLHGGTLPGATVIVAQAPSHVAHATAAGAFRLDSLPPGRYTLELMHPVVDSLGIRVMSDTVNVTAGGTQTVELAVPSAERIIASVCPPIRRRLGPGAIIGRVDDAVTGKPATGAEVSVAWTETQIGTDIGVQSAPRLRKDKAGPTGSYAICGIPATLSATLQAQRGDAKTAEVKIETTEEPLVVRVLHLPPPHVASNDSGGAPAGPVAGAASIVGTVTNAGGVPVAGANVSVQGTKATASTAPDGTFTITNVPPGTQAVLVRRVGYNPVQVPVDVKASGRNPLTVRLGAYAPQLKQVDVKANAPDMLESTGFTSRKKSGLGRYLDEEQIKNMRPTYTSDVLRRVPGLYVTGQGASAGVYTSRGYGCVNYLVDRNPINVSAGQTIDEIVNVTDVAAVEFYQTATIPLELSSTNTNGCALVVIWTKGSLKDPNKK